MSIEKEQNKSNIFSRNKLLSSRNRVLPLNYNFVTFEKEKRNFINKFYDISYSAKDELSKVSEEDLYKIIFKDEENDEYYYYMPYYNIEKNVLKDNFIEVMNKNKKFWNRSVNSPIDLSKYKDKWYDILYSIINTKEFNILDEEYTFENIKQFVDYFKSEIFDNKIIKERMNLDDEQKIIFNDKANILIKKVMMPLAQKENKTKEIYDLLDQICTHLTLNGSLNIIFDVKNCYLTGLFNIENVKLFCDLIYTIMTLYEHCPK